MKNKNFVHLHVHSHYSLLDGLSKIEDIIERCQDFEMPACALTDHGNMYGAVEFYKLAKSKGIKPIIGCEFYIAKTSYKQRDPKIDKKRYHLTILAKNTKGYKNLLKLNTIAWLEGFYYKPRIDYDLLEKYKDGLICLSGCLNGEIPKLILQGKLDQAKELILRLKNIFKDDFYLELQTHPNLEDQKTVNKALIDFSKRFKIPLVLTYDSHYLKPSQQDAHDVLLAIQTQQDQDKEERLSMKNEDFSFPSQEEILRLSKVLDIPEEAILNTIEIKDKIEDLDIIGTKKIMPRYKVPTNESEFLHLKKLVKIGIEKRLNNFKNFDSSKKRIYKKRIEYELDVIKKTGFSSYFLIVQDFTNWAKENGIMVGPGRGSAAGSLVSYLLNITDVDPIKYDLMFERFLNPERISFPDIDIDFADRRRDEVIEYARKKYGEENVAQIITFGKIKARQAVRDVGRVLGFPYSFCDKISKLIPPSFDLKKAIFEIPELRIQYNKDQNTKKLFDFALEIEGVARHASVHACGVVIGDKPLVEYIPLQYASPEQKIIITQYDMNSVEDIGLLKMDFLGLRNLTIIEDCINLVEKYKNIKVKLPQTFDDKKTFDLFQRGDTLGVFQLESDGMKRYLSKLKPTEFEDIIAMIALYRPGPLDAGQVDKYILRKHRKEKVKYLHKSLQPILEKTYGIAVYQEQLIEIAKQLAGFSYSEADKLRKAVGKKIKSLLLEEGEKLIKGMVKNGINEQTAKRIWEWFLPFARYGFNKSHSTSYAFLSYITAYLKAHYPLYFLTSLLINEGTKVERISEILTECKSKNIEILPPDINESEETFTPIEKDGKMMIRFGLGAIKNVGKNLVKDIIKTRNESGKFKSISDFIKKVRHKDLNKKSLEALIKAGVFDKLEERGLLLYNLDNILKLQRRKEEELANISLFGDEEINLVKTSNQVSLREKLKWERELLGLYISGHPIDIYKEKVSQIGFSIEKIKTSSLKTAKTVVLISLVKRVLTRTNKRMVFCKVEDLTGHAECIVFPELYEKSQHLLREENIIIIKGKIEKEEENLKIIASEIDEFKP